ncbi:O-antigen ligase family protein [Pseudomonas matsuisoli]|uniref:O-antigen ligase family protein n=1 Tax=Pseudomonas matsuisoli TaxID=1515666 RepID=UPI0016690E0F|nr:O-antigen ligase family protein [Pseudomonas matsuisoli]
MLKRNLLVFYFAAIVVLFFIFSFSAVGIFFEDYGWHDQQRILQVLFIIGCVIGVFFIRAKKFSFFYFSTISIFFSCGLISIFLSDFIWWSVKEWAVFLGLVFVVYTSSFVFESEEKVFYVFLLAGFIALCLALKFLIFYMSAIVSGIGDFSAEVLQPGFDNPRFLGQFQLVAIPASMYLVSYFWDSHQRILMLTFLVVLIVHWLLSIVLGGRGVWLALFLSNVAFSFFSSFRKYIFIQFFSLFVSAILFWFLFRFIPSLVGFNSFIFSGARTGLSSRELLWDRALDMFLESPWFGIGPMQFSAVYNSVAAHPHQIFLQIAAEWGGVALLMFVLTVFWGARDCIFFLKKRRAVNSDFVVVFILLNLFLLAQLDGVFVMPYVQTWFALFVGVILGRSSYGNGPQRQGLLACYFPVFLILILSSILFFDVPRLVEMENFYLHTTGGVWAPRFWFQGWIGL